MRPAMTAPEIAMLTGFLKMSVNYVEFGTGGNTVLAASLVARSIVSVDSSSVWLSKVEAACQSAKTKPRLVFTDIGPIGKLGFPEGKDHRHLWPRYHENVWSGGEASKADLYLIDGRFRVACFLATLLRSSSDALILVHDYALRPYYHVVGGFAREVCQVENLSAFLKSSDLDYAAVRTALAKYGNDPR